MEFKAEDLLKPSEKVPEGGVRILTEATDRDVALAIAFGKDNYAVNPEYVAGAEEIGAWPAKINFLPEPYSGDAGDETDDK